MLYWEKSSHSLLCNPRSDKGTGNGSDSQSMKSSYLPDGRQLGNAHVFLFWKKQRQAYQGAPGWFPSTLENSHSLLPGLLVNTVPQERAKVALEGSRCRILGLQNHLRRPEEKKQEQERNPFRALSCIFSPKYPGAMVFAHLSLCVCVCVLMLHSGPVKTKTLGTGPGWVWHMDTRHQETWGRKPLP